MARTKKAAAPAVTPASTTEARQWLLSQPTLPESVKVAPRGKLSTVAREFFTEKTGRPIESPATAA